MQICKLDENTLRCDVIFLAQRTKFCRPWCLLDNQTGPVTFSGGAGLGVGWTQGGDENAAGCCSDADHQMACVPSRVANVRRVTPLAKR